MVFDEDNLVYLLALQSVDGLGSARLKLILDYFESPQNAWVVPLQEFSKLQIPRNAIENLKLKRRELDPYKYYAEIQRSGIKVSTVFEDSYPTLLKEIPDAPILFFYKGNLENIGKSIAVVGTRKVTGYGRTVTEKLVRELLSYGVIIVSGLARGVDTIAHTVTVREGGRTIAVLGGGLHNIFPSENTRLSDEIVEGGGAVISEFTPDASSLPGNFPARNRIIAGLSVATLVTEAAEDSGSLITAHLAAEYNREVFAIPGPITSELSLGPASLINEGAKLVTSADQIIEELGISTQPLSVTPVQSIEFNDDEKLIIEALRNEQKHIDELCRELNKPSSLISGSLVKMEIKGFIKSLGGGFYVKNIY